MYKSEKYKMDKGQGKVMGHEKKPMKCDSFAAQRSDLSRLRPEPMNNRGYPSQAFGYKYQGIRMTQETGETRDAIIDADEKVIQDIINANKGLREPYWIVLFAKPAKVNVDGKPTLMKHIKAYRKKPKPQVGMITAEVNNQTGAISWDVNMPQRPFDYDGLLALGAQKADETVIETTSIPGAYITQQCRLLKGD